MCVFVRLGELVSLSVRAGVRACVSVCVCVCEFPDGGEGTRRTEADGGGRRRVNNIGNLCSSHVVDALNWRAELKHLPLDWALQSTQSARPQSERLDDLGPLGATSIGRSMN